MPKTPTKLVVDSPLSWSIWTKLFVFVVVIGLAAQVYLFLSFRQEIYQRRQAFCVSENVANQRQITLWEGVIAISQADQTEAERAESAKRTVRFRELLKNTFPTRDCDEF